MIVLAHRAGRPAVLHALRSPLAGRSLDGLEVGRRVAAGERIAAIGSADVNGGWPPHLHLQVIDDLLGLGCDFPGVAARRSARCGRRSAPTRTCCWAFRPGASRRPSRARPRRSPTAAASPRPQPEHRLPRAAEDRARLDAVPLRRRRAGGYLDAYNNVAHVGHCHPRVVRRRSGGRRRCSTPTPATCTTS